jgi:phospholipase C
VFQISVVNRSSTIADRELHRVVRAINRQIAEDFEPYWAFGGHLRVEGPIGSTADLQVLLELRGDAILYIMDSAVSNDALGFHDRNLAGIPYGFVFLDLCKQLGDEWSTTLSHEALELIGDSQCNLLVQGPHPSDKKKRVYHFFEMSDAVQAQSYEIDGVPVSNFVLPHYFTEGEEPGARNDFLATGLPSFGVNPGGYIGFFDPTTGNYDQYFAEMDEVATNRQAIKQRYGGGRVARRSLVAPVTQEGWRPKAASLQARLGEVTAGAAAAVDPIRHVVVLMMENRSFDHMLGGLYGAIPGLDGIDPNRPGQNVDAKTGKSFAQTPDAVDVVDEHFNVPHEFTDVQLQMQDRMGHFVDAYRNANPDAPDDHAKQVMAYFPEDALPALHKLAKNFMVCDRWFSSLPGPTWPNRLFVHSGTSLGVVEMPVMSHPASLSSFFTRYDQETIYDRLDDAKRTWKIFHDGVPQSLLLERLRDRLLSDAYDSMDDFDEAAAGPEHEFPEYVFIEPRYFDGYGGDEDDQHPPAGVMAGERLIARIYNKIRANEALWKSTLLIITWDEHGGFYDHVQPPPTVAPDDHTNTFAFNILGIRVPTLLVSPYVPAGVDHTTYDHTSILRYACEKWGMPHLCRRTQPAAGANIVGNFAHLVSLAAPREDTPTQLDAPPAPPKAAPVPFDDTRGALLAFAEMVQQGGQPAAPMMARRAEAGGKAAAADPAARAVAVEKWMREQKAAKSKGGS